MDVAWKMLPREPKIVDVVWTLVPVLYVHKHPLGCEGITDVQVVNTMTLEV